MTRHDVIRLVNKPAAWPPEAGPSGAAEVDLYRLTELDLEHIAGMSIGGDADQDFLFSHRDLLDGFARRGGRVLINGHVRREFITGIGGWRKIDFHGAGDLEIHQVTPHPVWEGLELTRLWLTLGGR